jgi:protease I
MTAIISARILIIATNGFEQSELEVPRDKLREAGASVDVATPDGKAIMGWDRKDWGRAASATLAIKDAKEGDYTALVIPGGAMNPDRLRVDEDAMAPVKAFLAAEGGGCGLSWALAAGGAGRRPEGPPRHVL